MIIVILSVILDIDLSRIDQNGKIIEKMRTNRLCDIIFFFFFYSTNILYEYENQKDYARPIYILQEI